MKADTAAAFKSSYKPLQDFETVSWNNRDSFYVVKYLSNSIHWHCMKATSHPLPFKRNPSEGCYYSRVLKYELDLFHDHASNSNHVFLESSFSFPICVSIKLARQRCFLDTMWLINRLKLFCFYGWFGSVFQLGETLIKNLKRSFWKILH